MFTTNLLPIKIDQYGSIGVEFWKGGIQDEIDFGQFSFLNFQKKYCSIRTKKLLDIRLRIF